MKVLVVTNLYPTAERPFASPFVKEQVESIRRLYPDIAVDVRVIEGERPRWPYVREMLRLPGIVRKGRYDIVHAHFGLTLVSTLFVRTPVVITFHGSDLQVSPTRQLSGLLAPRASKVIVVAERLKEALGYGEVIPCGIDVERFAPPASLGNGSCYEPTRKLRVLFPSNPARKEKNYGLFAAACDELENRGIRVERVHLVNIAKEKVPEIYWNCDVMLLTSLSEGSPTVIKEAIAAKLPFVSVDVGDVRQWAGQVAFGMVVRRDPGAIAGGVLALLSGTDRRESLDNSGCLDAMDIGNSARRVKMIYEEVLAERSVVSG